MNTERLTRLQKAISAIADVIKTQQSAEDQRIDADHLQAVITRIHDSFLNNWEKEHLPQIQSFRDASSDGIPTPALSVCGKGTQEIRWTKYLSYYLNPQSLHGLNGMFFSAFFGDFLKQHAIETVNFSDLLVEDEVCIGTIQKGERKYACICDLVITSADWILFIEQKIKSSESNHSVTGYTQLKSYTEAIRENPDYEGKKILKVFLTPSGKTAREVTDWVPMTHQDLIQAGLKLLKEDTLSPVARGNLIRFLLDLAVGTFDRTEELIREMRDLSELLCRHGFHLQSFIRYSYLNQQHAIINELIREGYQWKI